jgi:hypothetical protein
VFSFFAKFLNGIWAEEVTVLFCELLCFCSGLWVLEDETALLSRSNTGHLSHGDAAQPFQKSGHFNCSGFVDFSVHCGTTDQNSMFSLLENEFFKR